MSGKMRKIFCYMLTFFWMCGFCSTAGAEGLSAAEAKSWAENKGKEIVDILTSPSDALKYRRLDAIFNHDIDLDNAAKFVMGKYWRQMSEEQKARYLPLFKRYTNSAYKLYPLDIEQGAVTFTVDKAVADNRKVNIYCTVVIKKLENAADKTSQGGIKVIFEVVKNNGIIQVRDLKISESSFLISYRERFYKMLHQDSDDEIDWFLEDLEAIVEDNEAQVATQLGFSDE